MRKVTMTLGLLGVLVMASSASAVTLAFWHFDDETNLGTSLWQINPLGTVGAKTDYASDIGSAAAKLSVWGGGAADGTLVGTNGVASGSTANNFGAFSGTTLNDIRSVPAASGSLSIAGTDNNDKYFLLVLDDAVDNVELTYATRGTSTGFDTHTYEYSTDGGATWTPAGSTAANKTSTWTVFSKSFGSVFNATSGPDQNIIKIAVSGATGTSGNNRFDNILITGVPEPMTLALLSLGVVPMLRRRQR